MTTDFQYEIREVGVDDSAALFVVHAAITPTDAGRLLNWTQELEARLESGGRAWVIARGRRPAGYAAVDPLPGLPGVYDLTGGIVPARQRQGLGTRLLRHVQTAAERLDIRQLSCRVDRIEDPNAGFLLDRGFVVEHEECLLELTDLNHLPPIPVEPRGEFCTYPQARAIAEFCSVYEAAFEGTPWSQPFTEAEAETALVQPEDLLFLALDGTPVGFVWHEILPGGRGRVEPLGIARNHQGQGYGGRLLRAALHNLRQRGANLIEIGLWRQNTIAMNLYEGLGFLEAANWYYLACDLDGLKTE